MTETNVNIDGIEQEAPAAPIPAGSAEFKYNFKTEKIKNEKGEVIGDGRKHPTVAAVFPLPQEDELILALGATAPAENEAPSAEFQKKQFIMSAIYDAIKAAGKRQIEDFLEKNEKGIFTAGMFNLAELSFEYLATHPRERASSVPSDDDIKSFLSDYAHVMVHVVEHEPKRVKMHVDLFASKLAKCRTDKAVLAKLGEFLTVWASKTSQEKMEEFADVYEYLAGRIEKLLAAEPPKQVTAEAL